MCLAMILPRRNLRLSFIIHLTSVSLGMNLSMRYSRNVWGLTDGSGFNLSITKFDAKNGNFCFCWSFECHCPWVVFTLMSRLSPLIFPQQRSFTKFSSSASPNSLIKCLLHSNVDFVESLDPLTTNIK